MTHPLALLSVIILINNVSVHHPYVIAFVYNGAVNQKLAFSPVPLAPPSAGNLFSVNPGPFSTE